MKAAISVHLDTTLLQRANDYTRRTGISRNQQINDALRAYLDAQEQETTPQGRN